MNKVMSYDQALALIQDNDTVTICGSWVLLPERTLRELGQRFVKTGRPRNLTLVFPFSPADNFRQPGIEHLAHEGMIRRLVGGSFPCGVGTSPIRDLILGNKVESYNLPTGVLMQLFREMARKGPGLLTRVGLHTCVDPRQGGGRMNDLSREDLVEVVVLRGQEYLFYPSFPLRVALVRGTTADARGNVSMEEEASYLGALQQAMAVHTWGGKVIVQVKRLSPTPLPAKAVRIPGLLVDAVVIDPEQMQAANVDHDPSLSGETVAAADLQPLPLSAEKVIARRLAQEIAAGDAVVLGFGVSSLVPAVLAEANSLDRVTFLVEQGAIGGIPLSGFQFGCARNPEAFLDCPSQLDLFQGGGFNAAFLSFMQVSADGRVNVSKLKDRPTISAGVGGFMDIVQNARKLIFAGTFTTSGLNVHIEDGQLRIAREGAKKKFVRALDEVTFDPACTANDVVRFVTERGVLELVQGRLRLQEIAPGISCQQILASCEFPLQIDDPLPTMAASLFAK